MLRRPFAIAIAIGTLSAVAATPSAAVQPSPGCKLPSFERSESTEHSTKISSATRTWILDHPASLEAGKPLPLLFVFHGFGHSGAGIREGLPFRNLSQAEGFVAVYPTGLPVTLEIRGRSQRAPGWQLKPGGNRDVELTKAILAEVAEIVCIDLDRVYATGFSNGGFFSNLLGCELGEVFAAIAPVGGGGYRGVCKPKAPVAVMIHHGNRDNVVPIAMARASRDQWIEANGCAGDAEADDSCNRYPGCRPGGAVVYCVDDGGHSWPRAATEQIWRFLSSKSRDVGRRDDPR